MSYTNFTAWKRENKDATDFCIRIRTNIHRSEDSLEYLEKCKTLKILPKFSKISKKVVEKGSIQSKKVRELRERKFDAGREFPS